MAAYPKAGHVNVQCVTHLQPGHRMMMSSAVVLMEPCKVSFAAMNTNYPPRSERGVASATGTLF